MKTCTKFEGGRDEGLMKPQRGSTLFMGKDKTGGGNVIYWIREEKKQIYI
jgi:hypothetical protein